MGSIFGSKKAKPAKPYAAAQFKPYTYTSSLGTTTGTLSGDAFNVGSDIDPALTSLQQSALGYSQPYLEQYLGEAGKELPMFFGSGRLGLKLAGETVGAGEGTGMVNPDAYGLGLAQARVLSELSSGARTQAQQEQQQAFEQALGSYQTNLATGQQQLANLLSGFQGAFGTYGSVADLEQSLVNAGLSIEQARSAAQSASAGAGAQLAQAGSKAGNSFFQDLLLAGVSGASQNIGLPK